MMICHRTCLARAANCSLIRVWKLGRAEATDEPEVTETLDFCD